MQKGSDTLLRLRLPSDTISRPTIKNHIICDVFRSVSLLFTEVMSVLKFHMMMLDLRISTDSYECRFILPEYFLDSYEYLLDYWILSAATT